MGQGGVNPGARPGDGAVDPLGRKQERTDNAACLTGVSQRILKGGDIRKRGKVIECSYCIHGLSHTRLRGTAQGVSWSQTHARRPP